MSEVVKHTDEVTLTIDGIEVKAPKGTLLIRLAEKMGIEIPRFCDHPLLAPAGACRQCLVEVEGQRKPVASCTQTVADGMVVKTHLTSPVAKKAQAGIMELLLINHPLDCPMCDKGGECPLQNQAMSTGRADSRFHEQKREYPKPINISSQVLLDRERCVLCQRCTRFSDEIAGDKFIDLMDRSAAEQINVYRGEAYDGTDEEDVPFNSYFSGNTVQICPVGALTGTQYRFRARPFDLVSSPSVCEHCSAGCAQRTDHRRGKVMRRLAGEDPQVNEEWNCDKGRWGFRYATAFDRLTTPLIRENGELRAASWTEALHVAAQGLRTARDGAYGVGVLTGGRLTVEDAYAYSKFARVALHTNDIDFRARPLSAEETDFLAAYETGVSYVDVERAKHVVLIGIEPEEECPILFLRLRKAVKNFRAKVTAIAPFATRGLDKLHADVVTTLPGDEPAAMSKLELDADTLVIVGERLASVPGGLSGAAALASRYQGKIAWVPRRAGDRGAVDAGCLPNLLPGGRHVADAAARADFDAAWGLQAGHLPSAPGRGTDAILAAAAGGKLGALVVAGVDPADLSDPALAEQALDRVGFLVSLELRMSAVSRRANVVFPVAAVVEKAGSYVNWEGRLRTFEQALETPSTGATLPDARVLDALAAELGVKLGTSDVLSVRRELGSLPAGRGFEALAPTVSGGSAAALGPGEALLATWPLLIDLGGLLDGDEVLAGTARPSVIRLSKGRAAALGVADGDQVTVSTERGSISLPVLLTEMPDEVVWLPTNSPGSTVRRTLGPTAKVKVSR
ncbi:MAG TPA: NADH-quinone oxidoreductase subunit G [Candidatus Limnocylindrales bacterium]|nr:NADH-quinone oxidoreductase subunit G [Candidatus Limnocylindrales bacterium]